MAKLDIADWIIADHACGRRIHGRVVSSPDRKIRRATADTLVTQPTRPPRLNTAPFGPLAPSAPLPEASSAKTRPQAPRRRIRPPRPRKPARPPLNTPLRFVTTHIDDDRLRAAYVERGHRNYVQLSRTARDEIAPASAISLPATNYQARIRYAWIANAHVTRFTESLPRSVPVFWVTLISGEYTLGEDQAGGFDPYPLQQWALAMLPGCSFVGMVEAALYTNVAAVAFSMKRAVSWHVHMPLWGVTEQQIRKLCARINESVSTIIPGVKAAHYRRLEPEEVRGQVLYMLKAPVNEYRIYKRKKTVFDQETGEISEESTGRFATKKYQLGAGDIVRMTNIMAGQTLNKLSFAAGEGKAVLKAINDEALTRHRAVERRERNREASRRSMAAWRSGPKNRVHRR